MSVFARHVADYERGVLNGLETLNLLIDDLAKEPFETLRADVGEESTLGRHGRSRRLVRLQRTLGRGPAARRGRVPPRRPGPRRRGPLPSTATRDRDEKKGVYERNGVREYWLADPRARTITRFVSKGGRVDAGITFVEGDAASSTILEGFSLPVRDVFPPA